MNAASNDPQALSLYNSEALFLVAALALILLLASVAAILALRAGTRIGAIAGLSGALLMVAFLPLWVTLLWLQSPATQVPAALSSSYMWMTFASVIQLDRVFAMGALVSGVVYFVIPGTPRARLLRTFACLALVLVVAIIYAVIKLRAFGLVR
jgi:hypothetical protein